MGEKLQEAIKGILISLLKTYLNVTEETVKTEKTYVVVKKVAEGESDEINYLIYEDVCCNNETWRFGITEELNTDTAFIQLLLKKLKQELPNLMSADEEAWRECAQKVYFQSGYQLAEQIRKNFRIDLEMIKQLSSMYYEGDACYGELFFDMNDPQESEIGPELLFTDKSQVEFSDENARLLRKLLETTGAKAAKGSKKALWMRYCSGKWRAVGLGTVGAEKTEGVRFSFMGHMAWSMSISQKKIIEFKNYQYLNPLSCENELKRKFSEVFKLEDKENNKENDKENDKENSNENLMRLVDAARKQKHGTILIIMDSNTIAGELSGPLIGSGGTRLKDQLAFSEEMILRVSAIDGAVFVDTTGAIHGYGLILSGNYPVKGNPARGARYNSALRYIASMAHKEEQKVNAVAVVISEDGMLNVIGTKDQFETQDDQVK